MRHRTLSFSTTSSHTHRKAWLDRIACSRTTKVPPWSLQLPLTTIIIFLLALLATPINARPNTFYAPEFTNIAERASSSPQQSNGELDPISTASGSGSFEMPRAFDAAVGNNFTQPRCQRWFTNFIDEIQPCHPVSLMLQTSMSFFDATKSLTLITRVLDTSCAVNQAQCSTLMSRLAREIISDDVCSQDYQLQNPVVAQAYAGLLAYQPVFGATCLKNTGTAGSATPSAAGGSATSIRAAPTATASAGSGVFDKRGFEDTASDEDSEADDDTPLTHQHTRRHALPQLHSPQNTSPPSPSPPSSAVSTSQEGAYCYALSITNTTSPTSSYIYYLPLGFSLPGGTIPTCNTCLQDTMSLFAGYASDQSQPLSKVYGEAAGSVNVWCGPSFVGASSVGNGAVERGRGRGGWDGVVFVGAVVGAVLWVL